MVRALVGASLLAALTACAFLLAPAAHAKLGHKEWKEA